MKDPLFWLRGKTIGPMGIQIVKTALNWKLFSPRTMQLLSERLDEDSLLLICSLAPKELTDAFLPLTNQVIATRLKEVTGHTSDLDHLVASLEELETKHREDFYQALRNYITVLEQMYYHGNISYRHPEERMNIFFLLKLRYGDLTAFPSIDIQKWLKEVAKSDIIAIMQGHEEVKKHILSCIPSRNRKELEAECQTIEIPPHKTAYYQQRAMLTLSKLLDRHSIRLHKSDTDQVPQHHFIHELFEKFTHHFKISWVECQTFLQHLEKESLAVCLSTLPVETQHIYLANLSTRQVAEIKDMIQSLGTVPYNRIIECKQQAVNCFVECIQQKKITLTNELYLPLQAATYSKNLITDLSAEDRHLLFQDVTDQEFLHYFNPADRNILVLVLEAFDEEKRRSILQQHDRSGFFPQFFELDLHQKICKKYFSLLSSESIPSAPRTFSGLKPQTLQPSKRNKATNTQQNKQNKQQADHKSIIAPFFIAILIGIALFAVAQII